MKIYKFSKMINGIRFKFDLDLRPKTVFLTIMELIIVIAMIAFLIKLF